MLFNSLSFLYFFPLVVLGYFLIPQRFRWAFLLAGSYYFYMCWKAEYVLLILFSTIVDYFAAQMMVKTISQRHRRIWLGVSITANLGILFGFKYFTLFNESIRTVFEYYNVFYEVPGFQFLLPIGISFYTLQTMGYSIDVYRGEIKPEKHFGIFALYVTFFPQLVAGPIERASRLLPQFRRQVKFDYERMLSGLRLMLWGFFKKLVIADRLAVFVNTVYNNPADFQGFPIILATYLFAFQVYCDFSGYSDIAIGAARVLGIDLMKNFDRPFAAKSISELWRRWHISLSTWFRDYFYFSLGGNRAGRTRWFFNLYMVFLVSGLWHGAGWHFLIWGGIHGVYLIFAILSHSFRENMVRKLRLTAMPAVHRFIQVFTVFHLFVFSLIVFRANSLAEAWLLMRNSVNFTGPQLQSCLSVMNGYEFLIAFLAIAFMEVVQYLHTVNGAKSFFEKSPVFLRWTAYYSLIFAIWILGEFNQTEFIYFQF